MALRFERGLRDRGGNWKNTNPDHVTQATQICISGTNVWATASADNDYETSYHYVNSIRATTYINGNQVDVSCRGCNQVNRDGSVDAPFVGYGEIESKLVRYHPEITLKLKVLSLRLQGIKPIRLRRMRKHLQQLGRPV